MGTPQNETFPGELPLGWVMEHICIYFCPQKRRRRGNTEFDFFVAILVEIWCNWSQLGHLWWLPAENISEKLIYLLISPVSPASFTT